MFFALIFCLFGLSLYAEGTEELTIIAKNGEHKFTVEIAKTSYEQMKGLMNRTEMPLDHGMIFIYNSPRIMSFWMKNTLIPLDMVMILKNGTISKIFDSVPPLTLDSRRSDDPCQAVLELNGGVCKSLNIKVGDKVVSPSMAEAGIGKSSTRKLKNMNMDEMNEKNILRDVYINKELEKRRGIEQGMMNRRKLRTN